MAEPKTDEESELEKSRMPLLDHLIELRDRLMKGFAAIALGFIACYFFAGEIYTFLTKPLADALGPDSGRRMIFTALTEAFFTHLKLAFWASVCVTFPIVAGQVWAFVAPGLYRSERKAFLPFLVATPVLFLMGGALVYYVVMPLAWRFFLSFETPGGDGALPIQLEAKVNEYLSLVMTLILAFGLAFQMPVLLTLLARVGIISSQALKEKRRYAILGITVFSAVVTPPDAISMLTLMGPMLILYELSIWSARWAEKSRERAEAAEQAAAGTGST
ncbi:MAG: twin-arginine translocase subunit TatC [Alphaproteobacteria bacterium]|nr:twin-arginine translocase subunit TatC [Alphaproteobacteria bacterium]